MDYEKLLFRELRLVPFEEGGAELTDERLAAAVTLNENLQTLGYVLAPTDLVRLAVSPSLEGLYDRIAGMMETVDAPPMYPGFPRQVMEMDEAVFRFHQMVHYFSTYGMEDLFGVKVRRGWLPCEGESAAAKEQKIVLPAKTLQLLPEEERYRTPLRHILGRRERMTLPEREILREAVAHVTAAEVRDLKVGFKENMEALCVIVFAMDDREAAFALLGALCQHTGDVLRCADVLLRRHHYHFRTSQKRFLVRLLESYPASDFRANLMPSGKSAERNILLLNYLDYSVYSRSAEHMAAVNALRDGALRSWEGTARDMLAHGDEGALDFAAQRPGMLLRMAAWILRLGYPREEMFARLAQKSASLSMQTLVTILNWFGAMDVEKRPNAPEVYALFEALLSERMKYLDTPLRGKRVALRMDEYDLGASELRCSDKSAEGGYIRSGIARRIPGDIRFLRFFVYWNDSERVDVDLHAVYRDHSGVTGAVGWDQDFRKCGVVHSGDITHSDAAEYIDVDLTAPLDRVSLNVHLYDGRPDFGEMETCYVGMMAVPLENSDDDPGAAAALYSEGNCFFHHELRQKTRMLHYGYIDVTNRCLLFDGIPDQQNAWYGMTEHPLRRFSLARYLTLLFRAQEVTVCEKEEDADALLVMGKPGTKKEISLADANFFLDGSADEGRLDPVS